MSAFKYVFPSIRYLVLFLDPRSNLPQNLRLSSNLFNEFGDDAVKNQRIFFEARK